MLSWTGLWNVLRHRTSSLCFPFPENTQAPPYCEELFVDAETLPDAYIPQTFRKGLRCANIGIYLRKLRSYGELLSFILAWWIELFEACAR